MHNPFQFVYYTHNNAFASLVELYRPMNSVNNNVFSTFFGEGCLEMSVRVVIRSHSGDCEYAAIHEEPQIEYKRVIRVFCKIPEECINTEDGSLMDRYFDPVTKQVVLCEETSSWFLEWTRRVECIGSGVCGYVDTYTPLQIRIVDGK